MIDEDLRDFMDKVEIIKDNIGLYTNKERGLIYPLSVASLLCRVDYLELSTEEIKSAKFKKEIDDKDYKMYDLEKMVSKSEITKKQEDFYTLTKKTYKGAKIWNVSNQLKIHNTFENKEQAIKLCEEINKKVLDSIK